MKTITSPTSTLPIWFLALLTACSLPIILSSCSGGSGGGGTRSTLRSEYNRNPAAFKHKYGAGSRSSTSNGHSK